MRLALLLLLFCSTVSAQLNIRGTEYTIISDMGIENITVPRTNEERFPELDWTAIESGDFTSIVKAFVRDAVTHDVVLDLDDSRHVMRFLPSTNFDEGIGASSFSSLIPGYNIWINQDHWNSIIDQHRGESAGVRKIKLIYHELGHGLLHYDHVCEGRERLFYLPNSEFPQGVHIPAIMATGSCPTVANRLSRADDRYDQFHIEDLLDHFYEVVNPINQSSIHGKGSLSDVIHN